MQSIIQSTIDSIILNKLYILGEQAIFILVGVFIKRCLILNHKNKILDHPTVFGIACMTCF